MLLKTKLYDLIHPHILIIDFLMYHLPKKSILNIFTMLKKIRTESERVKNGNVKS